MRCATRMDARGQLMDTPLRDARCSHVFCRVRASHIDGRIMAGLVIRWTCGNHAEDKLRQAARWVTS